MIVGTLRMRLYLPGSHSLKDKRRVIKSLKERLSNKYNISVAEVDLQDVWQSAEIGAATVGTDTRFVQSVLETVLKEIRLHADAQLVQHEVETYGA